MMYDFLLLEYTGDCFKREPNVRNVNICNKMR
jgi:hypothetical protein